MKYGNDAKLRNNFAEQLGFRISSTRPIVGIVIGVGLMYWFLKAVPVSSLSNALQVVSPWRIAVAVIVLYSTLPLRALQWRLLTAQNKKAPFHAYWRAICFGHLANVFLPFRSGDILKSITLNRLTGQPLEHILVSAFYSRLQDILPILIFFLMGIFAMEYEIGGLGLLAEPLKDDLMLAPFYAQSLTAFLLLVLVGIMVLPPLYARYARNHMQRRGSEHRLWRWFDVRIAHVFAALSVIRDIRRFGCAQALAFLCWGVFALAPLPIFLQLCDTPYEAIRVLLLVNGVTTMVQLIPITPSGIGVYHLTCAAVVRQCRPDWPLDLSVSISIILHGIGTIGIALPGIPYVAHLWKTRVHRIQ